MNASSPFSMQSVRAWADMIKLAHSIFALPFALIATFMAGKHLPAGHLTAMHLSLIVICMVAARSFAMTFNRVADAEIDRRNPRTASRPLPAGKISTASAWVFLIATAVVFLIACLCFYWLFRNPWPMLLSVPTLFLLAAYSYTKRFTSLAHFVLGGAIAFAPTAAWLAIDPPSLGWPAILLSGTVLFWIAGFDIIYACQDVQADRREGLFSIPSRLGIARALIISRLCHLITMALLVLLGISEHMGPIYWVGTALTAILLAAEQWVVRPHDLSRVNMAFFTINGCVSVLLAIAAICDLFAR